MTASGYGIADIAARINRKLKGTLPAGMFCAACLVEMDSLESRVVVWNGGMPDVLVFVPGQGLARRLASRHMSLGILSPEAFDSSCDTFGTSKGMRLYLCSDGLTETENASGEMFGQTRLDACLSPQANPEGVYDEITEQHRRFCQGIAPRDDVTLIEVIAAPPANQAVATPSSRLSAPATLRPWQVRLELTAAALNQLDPLPEIMRLLSEFHDLDAHRETIFTILSELLGNAVDHGLLGMDSAMRATLEGFTAYYDTRNGRLKAVTDGFVRVHLSLSPRDRGGRLAMRIEDSGPGFDWQTKVRELETTTGYSGRGLPLLTALCESVRYEGNGNTVEAVYAWS
jgi:anti-sigma regulatory factor (Ser/Thr protein kinase)